MFDDTKNVESKQAVSGPISRQTKLIDLVIKYPDAAQIVSSYGLHCIGCMAAQFETIEMGCGAHGMPDTMIDELIDELNECVADILSKKEESSEEQAKTPSQ